jgi:hypothetical protein
LIQAFWGVLGVWRLIDNFSKFVQNRRHFTGLFTDCPPGIPNPALYRFAKVRSPCPCRDKLREPFATPPEAPEQRFPAWLKLWALPPPAGPEPTPLIRNKPCSQLVSQAEIMLQSYDSELLQALQVSFPMRPASKSLDSTALPIAAHHSCKSVRRSARGRPRHRQAVN